MFDQVVGYGANLFVAIIAVVIGFAAALAIVDYRKVSKEEEEKHKTH